MFHPILLLLSLFIVVIAASHQNYPGTSTRPVLSDSEASQYTKEKYLGGWTPDNVYTNNADYIVGAGGYTYIQEAVNAAIKSGSTTRKYIRVEKGTYNQIILIPPTTVPITIYGTPFKPEEVYITLTQSVSMDTATWANRVNPGGQVFKEGDPAWNMYSSCVKQQTIGLCSALIWAQADNLQIAHLTLDNPAKDAQALAARCSGDQQNWYNVHFYGFQDTLRADKRKRIYFNSPTIKGDVDLIYGNARAVFENAQIIARGDRPRNTAVIFAPNTEQADKYGFLVLNSKITADNDIAGRKGCRLARAWDSSSSSAVNGQLVIRETEIVDVINENAPFDTAAGGRPYAGNANTNRNLDDPNYNRFWEYKNTGGGA